MIATWNKEMNLAPSIQLDINRIERTYDTALVRNILSNKTLLSRTGTDDVSIFDPENQEDIIYLLPMRNDEILGVLVFHVFNNPICCQGHVNYLPEFWKTGLREHTKLAIDWIFENTDYTKIVSFAPDHYPEVKKHALSVGMTQEGYLVNSVLSDSELDNQSIMSIGV